MSFTRDIEDAIIKISHPFSFKGGSFSASLLMKNLKINHKTALDYLAIFLENKLVENPIYSDHLSEDLYKININLIKASEHILHKQQFRHPSLINQENKNLNDLILAIGNAPNIFNKRIVGPYLGHGLNIDLDILRIFLFKFSVEEINLALNDLEKSRLIKKELYQNLETYKITPLGEAGIDSINEQLKIGLNECILDLSQRKNIEIFLAWQSDYNPARSKISSTLEKIIEDFNQKLNLARPLQIVMATESGDGAIRIDQNLLDKIKQCEIFVGDLTICAKANGKAYFNPNVLIESGYALECKKSHQVILLECKRDIKDIPGDDSTHALFPFDITTVRRLSFDTPTSLKNQLEPELKKSLEKLNLILIR